jgi:NACalpha-BTF3-like transcription factor
MRAVAVLTRMVVILSLSNKANTSWLKFSGLFDSMSDLSNTREKPAEPVKELTENSDEWTVIPRESPSAHEDKESYLKDQLERAKNWIPEGDWTIEGSKEEIAQKWEEKVNRSQWTPNYDSGGDSTDEEKGEFLEVDIQELIRLTGASRRKVIQALRSADSDVSSAIIELVSVGKSANT